MQSEKRPLKVSVVIPIYNSSCHLKACLQAITKTAYPSDCFEIIAVDNNSSDDSSAIIKEFNVIYEFEENVGRSYARNRGVKKASFDYIAFVDSDMVVTPFWLNRLVWSIEGNLSGVQGRILLGFNSRNSAIGRFRKALTSSKLFLTRSYFNKFPYLDSACCIYRKDILLKLGGFDVDLFRLEDFDLSLRILLAGGSLKWVKGLVGVNYANYHSFWALLKKQFLDGRWHSYLRRKYRFLGRRKFFFPAFHLNCYYLIGDLFRFFGQFFSVKEPIELEMIPKEERCIYYYDSEYKLSPSVYLLQHYSQCCIASFYWNKRLVLDGDCRIVEEIFLSEENKINLNDYIKSYELEEQREDIISLIEALIERNVLLKDEI